MKSSDLLSERSNRPISEFRDVTSGNISEGTGFSKGLRSCGPSLVPEFVRRFNCPIVAELAQNDSNAASAKKPAPKRAAVREIWSSVLDSASWV